MLRIIELVENKAMSTKRSKIYYDGERPIFRISLTETEGLYKGFLIDPNRPLEKQNVFVSTFKAKSFEEALKNINIAETDKAILVQFMHYKHGVLQKSFFKQISK